MRIIDSIPHQSMTISIFQMNDKYQVKFEAGPMEQIFKFNVEEYFHHMFTYFSLS